MSFSAAHATSQMQELASELKISDFPDRVEQLLKNDHPAQALELAEIGLAKHGKNLQLLFMRTAALDALGRTDATVKSLRQIIAAYPEVPEPYNNLAVIQARRGQLEDALALLKQVLVINPDFALARKNMGDVYIALARENYVRAARDLPNNTALADRIEWLKHMDNLH